jgi:hypothetical protein
MNTEDIGFTTHALEKFSERYLNLHDVPLQDPEKTARRFLAQAEVDNSMSPGTKAMRIIDNDFQEADYYRFEGWRFVVVGNSVLTIERAWE